MLSHPPIEKQYIENFTATFYHNYFEQTEICAWATGQDGQYFLLDYNYTEFQSYCNNIVL